MEKKPEYYGYLTKIYVLQKMEEQSEDNSQGCHTSGIFKGPV
jgi:hypothetical protein